MKKQFPFVISLLVASLCFGAGPLLAESPETVEPAEEKLVSETGLTGDWGGVRTTMVENGLTIDLNGIYSYQNVAGGGLNFGNDNGSVFSGNLGFTLDTEKAGLWEDGLLKVRLDGRGGPNALRGAGATSPVNNQAVFPLVEGSGGGEVMALTELTFMQFLTEKFGLVGGLINTTYGDNNPITGNAISNQHFMNLGFLYSPVEAGVAPAVTLGGGVILLPAEGIQGSFTVFGSEETAGNDPFSLYEGTTFATEWEFEYELGGKPGGMVIGGLYSIDQLRRPFGSDPRFVLERIVAGEEIETDQDSWAVFWNGHQYLTGDEEHGMGVFARAGLSDGNPNPVRAHAALGLGGVGLFPGREIDRWGAGMYYQKLADGLITRVVGLDEEIGGEVFYNMALKPRINLTMDVQVVDSAVPRAGTVVVFGTRLAIGF